MNHRWLFAWLLAGVVAAAPMALAQQSQPSTKGKQGVRTQTPNPQLDNEELTPGQIERAQENEPPSNDLPKAKAKPKQPAQPARAVACSGNFGKDSSHMRLATAYKSENVVFMEVEGAPGTKVNASVLFPKDPKRRMEVWWENEAARQGIHLIVINGQSTWSVPKGVRLSLQLPALEKLNGKPFKLRGFDKDGVSQISDWQGGALGTLPGGCKIGVYLRPDPKAPEGARNEFPADKEFLSNEAPIRAVKPHVSEILVAY